MVVFYWSLSASKSPRISRTLLSILADPNNAVICKVSIIPLIFNSSSVVVIVVFYKHLKIVPRVPTAIGITVTIMFFFFFSTLIEGEPIL